MKTEASLVSTFLNEASQMRGEAKYSLNNIPFWACMLAALAVYGPMAAMSIAAGLATVAWLAWLSRMPSSEIRRTLKDILLSPYLKPSVILALVCIISLAIADSGHVTFLGMKPTVEWAKDLSKLWHLGFILILGSCLHSLSSRQLKRVGKLWLMGGLASAVFGIIQHYIPLYHPMELPDTGLRGLYHATGFAGFHLSYAAILGFPMACWFSLTAAYLKHKGMGRSTSFLIIGALIFGTAAMLTYSKTMWAALPATAMLIVFLGLTGRSRWVILIAFVSFAALWTQSAPFKARFTGLHSIEDRFSLWSANAEMIRQYPLLGVGWHHNSELSKAFYEKQEHDYYVQNGFNAKLYDTEKSKAFQSHAHNNFIDQWSSTGTLGLLAYLWWNFVAIGLAWKLFAMSDRSRFFARSMGLGIVAGWFCLHINGMTQTNFWDAKVMHQIAFIAALTAEFYRRESAVGDSPSC